jgi:hypothetical protein
MTDCPLHFRPLLALLFCFEFILNNLQLAAPFFNQITRRSTCRGYGFEVAQDLGSPQQLEAIKGKNVVTREEKPDMRGKYLCEELLMKRLPMEERLSKLL